MLYVQDDDLGRIDIGELSAADTGMIKYLLQAVSLRTKNPIIKDRARRLAAELEPCADYELGWSDVFLISSLLLNKAVVTTDPKTEELADCLLGKFEAAAKNIIESGVQGGN